MDKSGFEVLTRSPTTSQSEHERWEEVFLTNNLDDSVHNDPAASNLLAAKYQAPNASDGVRGKWVWRDEYIAPMMTVSLVFTP